MKEFDIKQFNPNPKTEISVQKKQQIEREYMGSINPYNGHHIWEINPENLEINLAMEIKKDTIEFVHNYKKVNTPNKEILFRKGFFYVSAINKKNALKKYLKGTNGSKKYGILPIKLF